MKTEDEIKKELENLKNEYVYGMNYGNMTATRKTKLNQRIEALIWVLQENEVK